jgi:hypothetical protein
MTQSAVHEIVQQQWITIITSWLGSGALSAIVAGIYNLRSKRTEYVNDYYKDVIKRRTKAYEQLEQLIIWLRTVSVGEDKQPYHLLFASAKEEDWQRVFMLIQQVSVHGLWLSNEVFAKTRELNVLLYQLDDPNKMIEFGKKNYQKIATIRHALETLLSRDMLRLYDVKQFLRSKDTPDPGFHTIDLHG